jgi:hypothetical protein
MSEDRDFIFPQNLLRGLGLIQGPSTKAQSLIVPQFFGWDDNGGYWATPAGQSKPAVAPPGASLTSGEWKEAIPYGSRISVSESHHDFLLTGEPAWIWYPMSFIPQWMNGTVWAMQSDKPPTTSPMFAVSAYTGGSAHESSPSPNSWVTTAGGYWIWVYTKPTEALAG